MVRVQPKLERATIFVVNEPQTTVIVSQTGGSQAKKEEQGRGEQSFHSRRFLGFRENPFSSISVPLYQRCFRTVNEKEALFRNGFTIRLAIMIMTVW